MSKTQYDRMSSLLLSSYFQYLLLTNNIVKSGTFTPCSNVADVKRKVLYQTKVFATKAASDPAISSEITAITSRSGSIRIPFVRDFSITSYGRSGLSSLFSGLFKGYIRERIETVHLAGGENAYVDFNIDLNEITIVIQESLYQSDAQLFDASDTDILPLSEKARILFEIIRKIPEILADIVGFRRRIKTFLNGNDVPTDKRWSVQELGWIITDIGQNLGYYDAGASRIRTMRQCAMMIRDLCTNPNVDASTLVYEVDNSPGIEMSNFDSRDTSRLIALSTWLTQKCEEVSSTTFTVEVIPPTVRQEEEVEAAQGLAGRRRTARIDPADMETPDPAIPEPPAGIERAGVEVAAQVLRAAGVNLDTVVNNVLADGFAPTWTTTTTAA